MDYFFKHWLILFWSACDVYVTNSDSLHLRMLPAATRLLYRFLPFSHCISKILQDGTTFHYCWSWSVHFGSRSVSLVGWGERCQGRRMRTRLSLEAVKRIFMKWNYGLTMALLCCWSSLPLLNCKSFGRNLCPSHLFAPTNCRSVTAKRKPLLPPHKETGMSSKLSHFHEILQRIKQTLIWG